METIFVWYARRKGKEEKMKIGDFVFAEYDNGEIVNGEVVRVREMGQQGGEILAWADGRMMDYRILVTVKAQQGYRSIYLDKCVTFDYLATSN